MATGDRTPPNPKLPKWLDHNRKMKAAARFNATAPRRTVIDNRKRGK